MPIRRPWNQLLAQVHDGEFVIRHLPYPLRVGRWPDVRAWEPALFWEPELQWKQGWVWKPAEETYRWIECTPDHSLPEPVSDIEAEWVPERLDREPPPVIARTLPDCDTLNQATTRCSIEYRRWLGTIPPEILQEARRYEIHAYRVLKIFSLSHPAGLELSCSGGHVLILGLADQLRQNRCDLRRIASLLERPRREIADYLGLPATKSAVRIFAKIQLEDISRDERFFHSLGLLFKDQFALLRARHLSRISGETLSILTDPQLLAICSLELLEATSGPAEFPFDIRGTLSDTLRMWREMRGDHPVPQVQSERHLYELHNELTEAFNAFSQERHMRYLRQLRFPRPPLPGNKVIVPVTSALDLLKEGRDCHHCVGSFYQEVAEGKCYVYRVLEPERATLMLSPSKRGAWQVSEVKAPCNRAIQQETQRMIDAWLAGDACTPAP